MEENNLYMLRLSILENLKDGETISFFLEEDCEEETKFSVRKEGLKYIVTLGSEVFGTQYADELFDGFIEMCEAETSQDIKIFWGTDCKVVSFEEIKEAKKIKLEEVEKLARISYTNNLRRRFILKLTKGKGIIKKEKPTNEEVFKAIENVLTDL